MHIDEFIERSNRAASRGELFGLLEKAALDEGFDHLAYGVLGVSQRAPAAEGLSPAVMLNYPEDWVKYYFEQGYQDHDPVIEFSPISLAAYVWEDLPLRFDLRPKQRRVMSEAREAGLKHGLSIPVHGPRSSLAILSFASSEDDVDPRAFGMRFQPLCAQFHVAYSELGATLRPEAQRVELTKRERECLSWVAQGKSSWDIGQILGITEFTVSYHVKKAMKKLGSGSRIVAVVKAIRQGLIRP